MDQVTENFLRREAVLKARPAALGTLVIITLSAVQSFVIYRGPSFGLAFVALGVVLCAIRLWLAGSLQKGNSSAPAPDSLSFTALMSLTRLSALQFSIWVAFLLHSFGSSHPTFLFSLILLSGLASAATATLATHPRIFSHYASLLFVIWLPFGLIHHFEIQFLLFAFISLAFIAFLFTSVKTLHAALVTQSTAANEARRQVDVVEAYLRAFPGYVTVLDSGLNYVFVSDNLRSTWGDEPLLKKLGWRNPDSDFTKRVKLFSVSKEPSIEFETLMERLPDLELRHFQVYLSRIARRNEILCLAVDIEDKVTLETERQRDRLRLESSSRLASLGEMAAGLAHEINNPLAIIDGNLALLPKYRDNEAGFALKLKSVRHAVDRIAKIVRAMRVFGRKDDQSEAQLISIDSVIESLVSLANERIRKQGIEFKMSLAAPSVLLIQEVSLGQILINLLNNAIDAVEGASNKWIEVLTHEGPEFIEIRIRDSGAGIPAELREKIMQPFYTTKAVGKGTGLGLSVSLRLAEAMGGSLALCENDAHTCFLLKIPHKAA